MPPLLIIWNLGKLFDPLNGGFLPFIIEEVQIILDIGKGGLFNIMYLNLTGASCFLCFGVCAA